jgi:hypothetical protein
MAAARPAGPPLGGAQIPHDRSEAPGRPDDPAHSIPVIVLASAHSGAGRLGSLLARHPDLACTAGTGILPRVVGSPGEEQSGCSLASRGLSTRV